MKNINQTVKIIVLASVLSLGISYVSAWTAPTTTPPGGNTAAPINTGSTAQTKSGQFNIATSPISSDTQIGSFGAPGSSSGVGYVTLGSVSAGGGFVGWDYANSGIALNSHQAGGSVGGLFVKRVDNAHSNVGIGTVSPSERLDVAGGIRSANYVNTNGLGEAYGGAGGVNTNYVHSTITDSWFPYPGNSWNYIRGNTFMNGFYPESDTNFYVFPTVTSRFNAVTANAVDTSSIRSSGGYTFGDGTTQTTAASGGSIPSNWTGYIMPTLSNANGECGYIYYYCNGTKITGMYNYQPTCVH